MTAFSARSVETMTDLTVLMAIHNAMPHLPETVESIRAQTMADWRMVVVNDGSTDDSVDYLKRLADPRIEIIDQENRGLGAALNHGLTYCDTPLLARMDGDDLCHPTRFAQQIAFLNSHPEVGLVGTQIERMGSRRSVGNSALATDHETIYADIARGVNQMYHPTIMCRTELIKQIGGYWEHPRGEEWDLFLRMGECTRLANLDQVLLSYRIHSGSMTGQSVKEIRTWIEYACECARRRASRLPEIEYDQYVDQLRGAAWYRRIARACEMHGRTQYRIGLGERLGERRKTGTLRIAYSALWSPSLCIGRLRRECGRLFGKQVAEQQDAPAKLAAPTQSIATNQLAETALSPPEPPEAIPLLGLPVHRLTMQQTVEHIVQSVQADQGGWVMTPNVDILRRWKRDSSFRELTRGVSLCVADGMPLVWASRIAGTPLPQRLNGTNLTRQLIDHAERQGLSVFFLGGAPGTADQVVRRMQSEHPNLRVAGTHCPPIGFEDDPDQLRKNDEAVLDSGADLVFVALGSPKQEQLIARMQSRMPGAWWLGVGATFDFLSGRIPRAPRWMQYCGLEWTHRLIQEPRRLAQRYLIDDLPFAASMLARSALGRFTRGRPAAASNLPLSKGSDRS